MTVASVLSVSSPSSSPASSRSRTATSISRCEVTPSCLRNYYVTLLLFQGQAIAALASDPLGSGADLLGTADRQIDYALIDATTTWYLQVALVVVGHVAALVLAHDRALVVHRNAQLAVRSQYWMLAVMVGFTSLALWLLSQANA